MQITLGDREYNCIIDKKNNKNTYIRINDNMEVVVTTSYFTSDRSIKKLLQENEQAIIKMINKKEIKIKKEENTDFFLFGKKYYIIYGNLFDEIDIRDNKIFALNEKKLKIFLNNYIKDIFINHLKLCYNNFEEKIDYPSLKIRDMKTRWGVCNYVKKTVTLNVNLYKYDIECLDYVIIHELSHLIHHNHSKSFWSIVSKYCPNYKDLRKKLRE